MKYLLTQELIFKSNVKTLNIHIDVLSQSYMNRFILILFIIRNIACHFTVSLLMQFLFLRISIKKSKNFVCFYVYCPYCQYIQSLASQPFIFGIIETHVAFDLDCLLHCGNQSIFFILLYHQKSRIKEHFNVLNLQFIKLYITVLTCIVPTTF